DSLAVAVLQQRAVLQTEATVEDRQEIAPRRLLDQHGGDIAPTTTAPGPRHIDAAPLNRGAVTRSQGVREARRQERALAAPVAPVVPLKAGQKGGIRHARKDLPQTVLGCPEPKP